MALHKYVKVSLGVTAALVVAALVGGELFLWTATDATPVRKLEKQAFFTTDDGATWFVDDFDRLTPFEHAGKQAVRAYVYSCDGGSPMVGYLERYTEEGKALHERFRAEQKASPNTMPPSLAQVDELGMGALDVKKPGEAKWVNMRDETAVAIMHVPCPNNGVRTPVKP